MKITQAIQEATDRIRVIPFGDQYQVIRPYYSLAHHIRAATCSDSMDHWSAHVHCRITRIVEVFVSVTGNQDAATELRYDLECNDDMGEDWRTVVRRAILEYDERN